MDLLLLFLLPPPLLSPSLPLCIEVYLQFQLQFISLGAARLLLFVKG
uniref:Uncharacterized protein n=1 Tax=Rhizophora mucronata TaxID=61149 RepID=A0A2P2PG48_RHIMU